MNWAREDFVRCRPLLRVARNSRGDTSRLSIAKRYLPCRKGRIHSVRTEQLEQLLRIRRHRCPGWENVLGKC